MTNIGSLLQTFIYMISASLLYPVLLLLSILIVCIIVYAGAFFAEWLERIRLVKCPAQGFPDLLIRGKFSSSVSHKVKLFIENLDRIISDGDDIEVAVENMLRQNAHMMWKTLDRLAIMVRVGPSLGLLGTLIPMGTGLAALGQGDMTRLSANMVIAFTTTVTGLAVGTVAFFFSTIRRRWIEEDIRNMELAAEILTSKKEESAHAIFQKAAN
jgi:biopolymer transport protein ExbB/TolQ